MSKNHLVKKKQIEKNPKKLMNSPNKKYWKYKTIPNKKIKIAQEVEKGQGLFGTIWNGVFCNLTNNISLWFICLFNSLNLLSSNQKRKYHIFKFLIYNLFFFSFSSFVYSVINLVSNIPTKGIKKKIQKK